MAEKRIQFSNIVQNQLPAFTKTEFPVVSDFLKQYYLGQEYEGGSIDLIQNIDQYVKVDEQTNLTEAVSLSINVISGKLKDGQTIIELSVCPVSNDVIGLRDLYLQLDISTSTFDTIVDEVSSGLDPAASNYVVTSSYANGNLVRS